jgi:hypothetical protein
LNTKDWPLPNSGVAPVEWTVKDYATNPATVHLLS